MEYSETEWTVTSTYNDDGMTVECDESFAPVEEEDWEETLRKPRTPARIKHIKRMDEILGGLR